MTFHFNIKYKTSFGEGLVLNVLTDKEVLRLPLSTVNGEQWSCEWSVKPSEKSCSYYYSVERDGCVSKTEWLLIKHRLDVTACRGDDYHIYDLWHDMPEDAYLYSSAFTDCINHQVPGEMPMNNSEKTVRIIVRAPQLCNGYHLGLVGADNILGAWNPQQLLPMTQHTYNEWAVDIDATCLQTNHLEFKFVAVDASKKDQVEWETGMNRTIDLPEMKAGEVVSYELDQAFFAWYNRKLAGTLVPVFSLRSEKGAGVGDFGDLIAMIDYVAKTE